jgi:hypothetical protein
VPQRTTPFQHAIYNYVQNLSENNGLLVEQSEMIPTSYSNKRREVDVTVRSGDGLTCIEVIESGRRASVEWVERMIGKHQALPTKNLILYSASGFAQTAYERAEVDRHWVTLIAAMASAPESLLIGGLGNNLEDLVVRLTHFEIDRVIVFTLTDEGECQAHLVAKPQAEQKLVPGTLDMYSELGKALRTPDAIEGFGLRRLQTTQIGRISAHWEGQRLAELTPPGGEPLRIHLGAVQDSPITCLEAFGVAKTKVFRVNLIYKQLPGGIVAYGGLHLNGKQVGAIAFVPMGDRQQFGITVDKSVDGAFGDKDNFALMVDLE